MIDKKVYTERALRIATYFGGPLVAGYFLSENFKLFNEEDFSRRIQLGSILFAIVFVEIVMLIPDSVFDKIPGVWLPLVYVFISYGIYSKYQDKRVEEFLNSGGEKQSIWNIIAVTLIGMIITFAYIYLRELIVVQ